MKRVRLDGKVKAVREVASNPDVVIAMIQDQSEGGVRTTQVLVDRTHIKTPIELNSSVTFEGDLQQMKASVPAKVKTLEETLAWLSATIAAVKPAMEELKKRLEPLTVDKFERVYATEGWILPEVAPGTTVVLTEAEAKSQANNGTIVGTDPFARK